MSSLIKVILNTDNFMSPRGGLCINTMVKFTTGSVKFNKNAPLFGLTAIGASGLPCSSVECSHTSKIVLLDKNRFGFTAIFPSSF